MDRQIDGMDAGKEASPISDILAALEAGEIDYDEAMRRIEGGDA